MLVASAMEEDVGEFRPLPLKTFHSKGVKETAEDRFWRRYKVIVTTKEVSRCC